MSSVRSPAGPVVLQPEGGHGGPAPPAEAGERLGRDALWLLLAIPVALVALVAWEFAMQTSAGFNDSERIRSWEVVLRELPATLLLLAPVAAGLTLGVRAARLGARNGMRAIWLHSAALFFVLFEIVLDAAESVTTAGPPNTEYVAFPGALAAAIAVLLWSLRAARQPAAGAPDRRAVLLPLVGVALAMLWLLGAQAALSHRAGAFPRAGVPGAVVVSVDEAGRYDVYAEGNAPDTVAELGVVVTDPQGRTVAVEPMAPRPEYLRKLRGGRAVGTFAATVPGTYTVAARAPGLPPVTAPYAPADPNGQFAVGRSLEGWMRPHVWGATALLVVAVAVSRWPRQRSVGSPGAGPGRRAPSP